MAYWNKHPAGYGQDKLHGAPGPEQSRNTSLAVPIVAERQRFPDFAAINNKALPVLPALVARCLPDGRRQGFEWVTRNPRRLDHRPGSFRVNLRTGRWTDFALEDVRDGDPVSLAAYLLGKMHSASACTLAEMLGVVS